MSDQRCSDSDQSKRDIPSFIEPRPPLISNPFMRPRPQKGTNLLELFEEDSEIEETEFVQVYLRLKPCNVKSNLYEVKSDRCLITSVDTATAGHGRRTQHNVSKMYTFSHIFGPETSQKEIFEVIVKDNLKRLPEGHNFTLLTYGASGSGKTYTLMGTVASPGLVPRALEYVFRVVDAAQQPIYKPSDGGAEQLEYAQHEFELQFVKRLRQVSAPLRDKYRRMSAQLRSDLTQSTFDLSNRTRYYVWVSFVEIYNEGIYDLLTQSDRTKATSKLRIREDTSGNAYVKGATQAFVRSGEEAYDIMVAGKHNLQVAATGVHAHSSRSHCIFTITMLTETDSGVRTSCVRLCDLAGCERAQKTRNTGARMQESRAINTSLHVLERCLHMLRRKQRQRVDSTLVPYRESKLTRLLGAGLSGAKGEAVSMVVTVNPAPQYSHETKHVLQLAAVAKDIQVNQTIAESILEFSSTTDTTIASSAEVMRLRADNERLHFELVQTQARNKELLASMDEKQQEMAKTMCEIVEEAKDMTKQYYEAVLQSLRTEMEEMQEEYESKLAEVQSLVDTKKPISEVGTPSRVLQNKVAQLMTEIAILEEKLTAEKLARARAEEEVQHLRACIEERDEKTEESENNDEIELTDSEGESEDEESCNESLEPNFRKEEINRSRLLQKSMLSHHSFISNDVKLDGDDESLQNKSDSYDSVLEKSNGIIKEDDMSKDETAKDSTYMTGVHEFTDNFGETFTNSCIYKNVKGDDTQNDVSELKNDSCDNNTSARGTYFVRNSENSLDDQNISKESNRSDVENRECNAKSLTTRGTYFVTNSDKSTENLSRNNSKTSTRETYYVTDSKLSQNKSGDGISSFQVDSVQVEKCSSNITNSVVDKIAELVTRNEKENKYIRSYESDASLAQFERLEKVANVSEPKVNITEPFKDVKIGKEKRIFFDNKPDDSKDLIKVNIEKNKTYFDNIDMHVNKNVGDIKNLQLYDDRSPSIVKDEGTKDFEPNKIKILLGESFTRQADLLSSVHKVVLPKKHLSVDLFEGLDSPVVKPSENIVSNLSDIVEKKHGSQNVQGDINNSQSDSDTKSGMPGKPNVSKVAMEWDIINDNDKNINIKLINDKASKIDSSLKALATNGPSIIEMTRKSIEKMVLEQKSDAKKTEKKPVIKDVPSVEEPSINILIATANEVLEQKRDAKKTEKVPAIKNIPSSIEKMVLEQNSHAKKTEKELATKDVSSVGEPAAAIPTTTVNDESRLEQPIKPNNTVEDFETIYKDLTAPRATEFDIIFSQEPNTTHCNEISKNESKIEAENLKYNLRHNTSKKEKVKDDKIQQREVRTELKPPKRNLRLRKRKCQEGDEKSKGNEPTKLNDIANLQKEFSDVTLDVPAAKNEIKDMPSPEKGSEEDENLPPMNGAQSCPSKSITRSRRKLFTPRAEVLEESLAATGDSNERVCVPRPSYHRPRARRKL